MSDVSFDRAADFYDRTRKVSPELATAEIELLAGMLAGARRVCEVGVGTGRLAIPLTALGCPVVGVDLSARMLARLVAKRTHPLPVVQASVTALPFHDTLFDGVIAGHVLHLVERWQDAVAEMTRVLRPGGLVLAARGGMNELGEWVRTAVAAHAGLTRLTVGLDDLAELDQYLGARGFVIERVPALAPAPSVTAANLFDRIAANIYSYTWPMTDSDRLAAVAAVRASFTRTHGDPETTLVPARPVQWHAYRKPG